MTELDRKYGTHENEANDIFLYGVIENYFAFNHFFDNTNFYRTTICVMRLSGIADHIPLIVSEFLIPNVEDFKPGTVVEIRGNVRSFHKQISNNENQLELYVYPYYLNIISEKRTLENDDYYNYVKLGGYLYRKPYIKVKENGKEVAIFSLRVRKKKGIDLFISVPCVAWFEIAEYVKNCEIGKSITIYGRLQSRNFLKKNSETGEMEERVYYEVAVSEIN